MIQINIPKYLKTSDSYVSLLYELKRILNSNAKVIIDPTNPASVVNPSLPSLLIFAGKTSYGLLAEKLVKDLEDEYRLKCGVIELAKYQDSYEDYFCAEAKNYDYVLGIGGGKVLDFAKYIAAKSKKNFISIPTMISHDGICSPVSVVNGKSLGAVMPRALIVPVYLIQQNPSIEHIKAGIGDLIANISALEDWHLANKYNSEEMNDFAVSLAKQAAFSILDKLENKLSSSKDEMTELLKSSEFIVSLVEALSLSGIAMSISGNSRPCSGAEHLISHAIDELYGAGVKALHGIQVFAATLYLDAMREEKFLKHNYSLSKIAELLDMPKDLEALGIEASEIDKLLELAPKTRTGRYTVLDRSSIRI